ncbi:hypothetical protein F441_10117 [Phytophthora nicotianae CJ01A1]|nr:hypothetical protein L915_09955 [Phytophthora nicotianae]ETM44971.1 hypothetical protein L914_09841 [Phytophthora nicotianae]ETO73855.1 hypothetical protein F444_10272 [Phytophthora nicotianae P1976]ETP15009.1 hypothetical protein F441_10117 [Phytophthora nicotianae CJ01A1]
MKSKILLGLVAVTAILMLGYLVNGLPTERGQYPLESTVLEDTDTTADCRPGASYWPACRSIGYPGCMPGVVRWPQCKTDPTRD